MAIGFNTTSSYGSRQIRPDSAVSRKTAPRVQLAQFGDGYEQRLVTGINPLEEAYDVAFTNRARGEADDIIAFFEAQKGATNFTFIVPDHSTAAVAADVYEKSIEVVCSDWSIAYVNAEASSVSATFRRVYES